MDKITAEYFVSECEKDGVKIERLNLDSGLLTLRKDFKPGDLSEYSEAESSTSIIYSVPCVKSQSSTWGTTGDGVGGYVGCKNGVMRINRSSCKKAFLKEVKRILESKGITFQNGES